MTHESQNVTKLCAVIKSARTKLMSSQAPDLSMNEWIANVNDQFRTKNSSRDKLNVWCNWNFCSVNTHSVEEISSESNIWKFIIVISWHTISHDLDIIFISWRHIISRSNHLFVCEKGHFGDTKSQKLKSPRPRMNTSSGAYKMINIILN